MTERLALYGVARRDAEAPAELIDPATVLATLLLHQADLVVGTGALRRLGEDVEAKRMFVVPGARGRGYGRLLLE